MCGTAGIVCNDTRKGLDILIKAGEYLKRRGPDSIGAGLVNPYTNTIISRRYTKPIDELFIREIKGIAFDTRATLFLLQTKYSTRTNVQKQDKESLELNAQPMHLWYDGLAGIVNDCLGVHNGEVEDDKIKDFLKIHSPMKATVDSRYLTEIYFQKLSESNDEWKAAEWVMNNVEGAFTFGFSEGDSLIFFKDKRGYRPLCIGETDGLIMLTSESGFFNDYNLDFIDEVKPGEMVKVDRDLRYEKRLLVDYSPKAPCAFEDIYFKDFISRDFTGEHSVRETRERVGIELYKFYKNELDNFDFVVPVIESGNTYGQAFAAASGKMFKDVVRKPERDVRYFLRAKVEKEHKYSVDDLIVRGKDILATDDSLVRGDTIVEFYASLKKAGAKTVSFMIAWPPIFFTCNNGIDTPTREELYAHKLIERDLIEYNGGEVKYDVHRVNDMITGLLRDDIRQECPEINPNDLYVYYGTNEILAESLPYKQKCSLCHTGVPPK